MSGTEAQRRMVATASTNSPRADQVKSELIERVVSSINSLFNIDIDIEEELIERLATIYLSSEGRKVLNHLVKHKALTTKTIQAEEIIARDSLSRILNGLRDLGVIFKCADMRDPRLKRRGPKFDVWLLAGADPQYAREAQKRHLELLREESKHVEGYEQATLDEVKTFLKTCVGPRREALLRDLIPQLRARGISIELARAAAQELNNSEAIRIWC